MNKLRSVLICRATTLKLKSLHCFCFRLQKTLPAGRSFVAMDTKQIPQILQQIFTSTMLSSAWPTPRAQPGSSYSLHVVYSIQPQTELHPNRQCQHLAAPVGSCWWGSVQPGNGKRSAKACDHPQDYCVKFPPKVLHTRHEHTAWVQWMYFKSAMNVLRSSREAGLQFVHCARGVWRLNPQTVVRKQ